MTATTSPYANASDALPGGTVGAVLTGGGTAGPTGASTCRTADGDTRARFTARGVRVIGTPVQGVVDHGARGVRIFGTPVQEVADHGDGTLAGSMEDLPDHMGRRWSAGTAGTTEVPVVRVAGNATDLSAQARASTAAGASAEVGALVGSRINAVPVTADAAAALAAARGETPAP
ncbi:hypothetical protein [Streptomyces sp. NPDC088789]|uniref:hypothetical protein n=1 Tax=Streptomyces sp. NPDC088789 TaxID=3365899 RepID=UPI0038191738